MAGYTVLGEAGPTHLKQLSNAAPWGTSSFILSTLYREQTRKKKSGLMLTQRSLEEYGKIISCTIQEKGKEKWPRMGQVLK